MNRQEFELMLIEGEVCMKAKRVIERVAYSNNTSLPDRLILIVEGQLENPITVEDENGPYTSFFFTMVIRSETKLREYLDNKNVIIGKPKLTKERTIIII